MSYPSVTVTYDKYNFSLFRDNEPIFYSVVRLYAEETRVLSGPWRIDVLDLFSEAPHYVISRFPLTDDEGPIMQKLFAKALESKDK